MYQTNLVFEKIDIIFLQIYQNEKILRTKVVHSIKNKKKNKKMKVV